MLTVIFMCSLVFFNVTATTEIYTLSLHDALPIYRRRRGCRNQWTQKSYRRSRYISRCDMESRPGDALPRGRQVLDRKSTRLNSSHRCISYAVFCLKKKK